jgi:ribosome modulation factor
MDENKDYYAEGYDAAIAGMDETSNPYDPVEQEDAYMSWNDGYMAAECDD